MLHIKPLSLAAREVERPAPDHDACQGKEDERPEPIRHQVTTPHAPTVTPNAGDVRSGRLRSANAEPSGRKPRRPAHEAARNRQPDGPAAGLPHPPGLEAGGAGARGGDPRGEG